jgi:hypothetical protein
VYGPRADPPARSESRARNEADLMIHACDHPVAPEKHERGIGAAVGLMGCGEPPDRHENAVPSLGVGDDRLEHPSFKTGRAGIMAVGCRYAKGYLVGLIGLREGNPRSFCRLVPEPNGGHAQRDGQSVLRFRVRRRGI